ncbi:TIGR03809 family protein [Bradyrhizobium roseum]|uniref:TIGR03809 family protein n=1 Tax=Bradyrhizobium roseum TaxID=3056648 RepID=UPI00260CA21A|nr:TIGR03809 family protein [Bradyrhizobium roseus]WKA30879.1 TIGR03809 family protein [Bradyrhizobium roseus]
MAHPADVARGRNIVARWCNLAERRLEHLTELFESGRWRRYHSEREFLENIQEAKVAVETWRDLLSREAALDNTAIDLTWLGRRRTTPLPLTPLPRDQGLHQPIVQLKPKPAPAVVAAAVAATPVVTPPVVAAPVIAATPFREVPADVLVALESQLVAADEARSAPDGLGLDEMQFPALDLDAMKDRYPLLRNAL